MRHLQSDQYSALVPSRLTSKWLAVEAGMGAGASTCAEGQQFVSTETQEQLATLPAAVIDELEELRAELERLRLDALRIEQTHGDDGLWMGHNCVRVPAQTRQRRGRSRSPIWSGLCTDTEEHLRSLSSDAQEELEALRAELDALRRQQATREEYAMLCTPMQIELQRGRH
jgi:hypothetical protein